MNDIWEAVLADGSKVGETSNPLVINQPIKKLSIQNPRVTIEKCLSYYLVISASFFPNGTVKYRSIEIGGLQENGLFHGYHLSGKGLEKKIYSANSFPYKNALKPGLV